MFYQLPLSDHSIFTTVRISAAAKCVLAAFAITLSISTLGVAQQIVASKMATPSVPKIPLMVSEEIGDDLSPSPLPPETRAVLKFLESQLDIQFELRRQPWKRALDRAMVGEGLIFGVSKTKARLKVLNFSETLYEDGVWLVSRCDATFPFRTLEDLKGKTIGVVRGASSGEEFDAQANKLFRVEDDTGATQGRFTKLAQKRMDALVFYKANSTPERLSEELNRLYTPPAFAHTKLQGKPLFCVLPQTITTTSIHIGLAKTQDQSLIQRINQAILTGRKNGSLQKIISAEQDRN
ncbi:transporter substrate-binding domain-containing protein [Undibacterium cyanobacteriorum]|uniref:Transporter substrate-binding domain-containing protein n=1 Tax=Undibacterium cyanobacteriorum TaxID=3073561 RepID=A0ABY9RIU8_9BURK|nr:transporter substrate-binding domain-containing protein [Undibacterium sp. 20NA77.5]WMW81153.1 transporter substrate-binding domain-containing protein [Undibacterium sp. 20NA77.5]